MINNNYINTSVCLLQSLFILVFETGYPTEPGFYQFHGAGWPESSWDTPVSVSPELVPPALLGGEMRSSSFKHHRIATARLMFKSLEKQNCDFSCGYPRKLSSFVSAFVVSYTLRRFEVYFFHGERRLGTTMKNEDLGDAVPVELGFPGLCKERKQLRTGVCKLV